MMLYFFLMIAIWSHNEWCLSQCNMLLPKPFILLKRTGSQNRASYFLINIIFLHNSTTMNRGPPVKRPWTAGSGPTNWESPAFTSLRTHLIWQAQHSFYQRSHFTLTLIGWCNFLAFLLKFNSHIFQIQQL